jgi:hypothetical protein
MKKKKKEKKSSLFRLGSSGLAGAFNQLVCRRDTIIE